MSAFEIKSIHKKKNAKIEENEQTLANLSSAQFDREHRLHCVRSVPTILVKLLPYRPPARLIRAKSELTAWVSCLTAEPVWHYAPGKHGNRYWDR